METVATAIVARRGRSDRRYQQPGAENRAARLEEAVAACRAALEVFEPAEATQYANIARANLARAEALLAERRTGQGR